MIPRFWEYLVERRFSTPITMTVVGDPVHPGTEFDLAVKHPIRVDEILE